MRLVTRRQIVSIRNKMWKEINQIVEEAEDQIELLQEREEWQVTKRPLPEIEF